MIEFKNLQNFASNTSQNTAAQEDLASRNIQNCTANISTDPSIQQKKIVLTALATFGFLAFQMHVSFTTAIPIAFTVSILNFACDKYTKRPSQQIDWLGNDYSRLALIFWGAVTVFRPLALDILYSYCGLGNVSIPQIGLVESLMKEPLQMTVLSCVVAPFCEEILFRGVLMERLEDLAHIFSQNVLKISELAQKIIAGSIQSFLFAAMHLNQNVAKGYKLVIFCMHSYAGIYNTIWKETYQTLISPFFIHSLNNLSFVLLAFKQRVFQTI